MRIALVFALLASAAFPLEEEIRKSTKLPAGTHRLKKPIRVVADGVRIDLTDAVLAGADDGTPPDRYEGIEILIEGRKGVTIVRGRLKGFRCAILVKDCHDVVISGVDVSGNFRQRLKSTPEAEDAADWLRPHDNDKQEWRKRYGAGICLENSTKCRVMECIGKNSRTGFSWTAARTAGSTATTT